MTNILIKSALALSLGTVGIPAFAQTEQPAQGQSTECPAGTKCPKGGGTEQNQQPDTQGSTQSKTQSQDQQDSNGVQMGTGQKQPDTQGQTQQGQSTEQQKTHRKKTGAAESQTQEQSGTTQQNNASQTQKSGSGQSGNEQPTQQGEANKSGQGKSNSSTTNVTVEQKTEITQVIKEEKVRPVDVDFDVSVGVVVPRTIKAKLQPLPRRIVQIVPAYQGYLYFVLADGRIVIVDPSSLEVVVVIA
ncbi:DUF1236 domain-containing protein [Ensifer sp. B1-9]|uniref:DUF1236 domain-containing protein n=1 Tax=Ensifer sp. B1-9 TaxID=3141455 RepID=UPI003D1A6133